MGVCMSHSAVLAKPIPLHKESSMRRSVNVETQSFRSSSGSHLEVDTSYSPQGEIRFAPTSPGFSPKRLQLSPSRRKSYFQSFEEEKTPNHGFKSHDVVKRKPKRLSAEAILQAQNTMDNSDIPYNDRPSYVLSTQNEHNWIIWYNENNSSQEQVLLFALLLIFCSMMCIYRLFMLPILNALSK
jgi:hypothetical protein